MTIRVAALLGLVLVLCLGACGSSDETATGVDKQATTQAPGAEGPGFEAAVSTGTPGGIGPVVVDEFGRTLYRYSKDKPNTLQTNCYDKCEEVWAPYLTEGPPKTEGGLQESLRGTMRRFGGLTQVMYAGWPMYTYVNDPPNALGGFGLESFGGNWYPLSPSGKVVR
jgi:predicted lipoprotein with Yx(FWY)xxD motif